MVAVAVAVAVAEAVLEGVGVPLSRRASPAGVTPLVCRVHISPARASLACLVAFQSV